MLRSRSSGWSNMRRVGTFFALASVVTAVACAAGERPFAPADAGGAPEATASTDAGADARRPRPDAGLIAIDSGHDAAHVDATPQWDGSVGHEAGALDPAVVLPDPSGASCDPPGNPTVCGGVRACRLASPTSPGGRCDDCTPQGTCNGLVTTACQNSLDCDVDLQCFRGRCTLFCSLSLGGPECGNPGICIDVGHPTVGLCDPYQLF